MKFRQIFVHARKWLKRLALAYMLGFASSMGKDTKLIEDHFFKIEQREDLED